jgi:type I restriction enzyme S subunit
MNNLQASDWREVLVADTISEIQTGVSVNSENRRIGASEVGILKTSCISRGQFFPDEHKAVIADEVQRVKTPLKKESILMSRMNTPNLVGEVGYVQHQYPGIYLPDRLWMFEGKEDTANTLFLSHLLSSDGFRQKLSDIATGTSGSMKNIPQRSFLQIPILLPPLPEQKKIAEILSGIDNLIQATGERICRLKLALDGLANSWETQLSTQKEEGTLGDLIDSIDSGWSPACEEIPPKSGEWGVLKVSAVTRGQFHEAESKRLPADLPPREQFIVKKNDLLITRANGNLDLVGRGVIVTKEPDAKLLMSDKILRLNPRLDCDRNFLLLMLNSRSVRQQIEVGVGGSTGAKNIGQGFLRQIAIAIPSQSDQVRIGNLSHSLSDALFSTKRKHEHLVSLKQGFSSDLLSGHKRVSV